MARAGLKNGDAVGPYRVTGELGRWPEHRLYRAVLDGQDRPFLVRELVPGEDEARARKRLALEAERFALAKAVLRRPSPYRPAFIDYVDERFAVFAHRNLDRLSGNAAGAKIASEGELRRLATPVIAVLHELHRSGLICCSIRPEEILTDPDDATVPIFAGLQHVYHLRGMGPQRPGRGEAGLFAPEFAQRQRPLTVAADVYALAGLMLSLLHGEAGSDFSDERMIEAALRSIDSAMCSDRLREALILGLKPDPAQRPQSIAAFEEQAFGSGAKSSPAFDVVGADRHAAKPLAPWRKRPEPVVQTADDATREAEARAEIEAVPPWPPIRAYLDGPKGQPRSAAPSAPKDTAQESEIAVAARGLADALAECVLAPARLARSTASDAAKAVWGAPSAIKAAFAGERRVLAIAAALAGVAIVSLWSEHLYKTPARDASLRGLVSGGVREASLAASSDDLVRLPAAVRARVAVEDELLSPAAARALKPHVLTVDGKPVMVTLPEVQQPNTVSLAVAGSDTVTNQDQTVPAAPEIDPAIAALQTGLQRLGLYHGTVDGLMGPQTLAGIRAVARALRENLNDRSGDQLAAIVQTMTPTQAELARALIATPKASQVVEARAIAQPLPSFPSDAFARRIEGWIEVSFDVDPHGEIEHAKVTAFNNGRALEAFSAQALEAIDHAVYAPARKNGTPVWSRGLKVRYMFGVIHRGWGPFKSREPHLSIIADSSAPGAAGPTLQ